MHWPNPRTAAAMIAVAIVVAITVYVSQQRKIASSELQRQSALADREDAVAAREEALALLRAKEQELKTLDQQKRELLRLRSEIAGLARQTTKEKEQPPPGTSEVGAPALAPEPGVYISKDQLAFVGFATPESCWESCIWAFLSGNFDVMTNSFSPEMQREFDDPNFKREFETMMTTNKQNFKGMQILARKEIADGRVELKIRMRDNADQISIEPMLKVGDEWKRHGNSSAYTLEWEKSGTIETFTP